MSSSAARKAPRFFIINPVNDRRIEVRFESTQKIQLFEPAIDRTLDASAFDIGRRGMRIETPQHLNPGDTVQISFPESHDAIHCYGRIVWTRRKEEGHHFLSGIEVQSWHGIVAGPDSWQRLKGTRPQRERRRKTR